MRKNFLLAGSCILLAAPVHAQTDAMNSFVRARAVVQQGLDALGGSAAVRSLNAMTIEMTGPDFARLQSRASLPPYDRFPRVQRLVFDRGARRLLAEDRRELPGFVWWTRRIIDGDRSFVVDLMNRTYTPQTAPGLEERIARAFPQEMLATVLDRHAETLRYLGRESAGGAAYDVVAYSANGVATNLYFDAATHLLARTAAVNGDMLGDGLVERLYSGWRSHGGVQMPARVVDRRAGDVVAETDYTVSLSASFAPEQIGLPSGFSERTPPTGPQQDRVTRMAPDVYLIEVGYNVLAVAFDDYVLAIEAPRGLTRTAIEKIRETIPGKPIRYVAVTHHHDDHAGDIREFIAEGATVVTTPGNREFFERVARNPHTIEPDALTRAPRPLSIEVVQGGKRVFHDAHHVVELYDIGPGGHTNEMLVAYLPNEKILFQGDLLNLPPDLYTPAANATTEHFAAWLQKSGLDVQTMAGVHAPVHGMQQLRESIEKARAFKASQAARR